MSMESKVSVEDVWRKLKSQAPCHNVSNLLRGEAVKVKDSGKMVHGKATRNLVRGREVKHSLVGEPRVISFVGVESEGELEVAFQKEVQAMKNGSTEDRTEAIRTIKVSLLGGCKGNGAPTAVVNAVVGGVVMKALLKRFEDSNDYCRELAVDTVIGLMKVAHDAAMPMLPYAVPVVEHRTQLEEKTKGPLEQDEEIRLKLYKLIHILTRDAGAAMAAYGAELRCILEIGCQDNYHAINVEACNILMTLDGTLGDRLHQTSKEFIAMAMPLTTHKRQKVRIAAIQAVKMLMHRGAHEMVLEITSFIHPNIVPVKAFYGEDLKVNFCGKLATDPCQKVRLEFLLMIGDWMLNLRERVDHESRLIPYVLSALNDECADISGTAVEILDALGTQYEDEHKEDLKDTIYYLPQEAHSLGWGTQDAICAIWETTEGSLQQDIFKPFQQRPKLGTRILVQANFSRMIKAIKSELTSWQSEIRTRTMQLLRSCLLLVEDYAAQWLIPLLDGICQVGVNMRTYIQSQLVQVIRQDGLIPFAVDCCFILGCFVGLNKHLDYLLPCLMDEDASSTTKTALLQLTSNILKGSAIRRDNHTEIQRLVACLDNSMLHESRDTNIVLAHFECAFSVSGVSELKGKVICMEQVVLMLLRSCANIAVHSQKSAEECINRLLEHLEKISKGVDTDLVTFMHNQRCYIKKQVWGLRPCFSEQGILLIAWLLVPFTKSNLLAVHHGKLQNKFEPESRSKAEQQPPPPPTTNKSEIRNLLEIVSEATTICGNHPDSFIRLLAAASIALSEESISLLDDELYREWCADALKMSRDGESEACLLGCLTCVANLGLYHLSPGGKGLDFWGFIIEGLGHTAHAVRLKCCCISEKLFSDGRHLRAEELSGTSGIISGLFARLDDSREVIRRAAGRALEQASCRIAEATHCTEDADQLDGIGKRAREELNDLLELIRREISKRDLVESG